MRKPIPREGRQWPRVTQLTTSGAQIQTPSGAETGGVGHSRRRQMHHQSLGDGERRGHFGGMVRFQGSDPRARGLAKGKSILPCYLHGCCEDSLWPVSALHGSEGSALWKEGCVLRTFPGDMPCRPGWLGDAV